jgi:hypothetical protein
MVGLRETSFMQRGKDGTGAAPGDVRALHEAAHVLVGILLGWKIGWVKVYGFRTSTRTGFDGEVKMAPPPRSSLRHRSAVRLAGEIAETICTDRNAEQIRVDSEDDQEKLWGSDLSRCHLSTRRMDQLVRQGRVLATSIIEDNSEAFMGLARAISRHPMTGAQARRIVARTSSLQRLPRAFHDVRPAGRREGRSRS